MREGKQKLKHYIMNYAMLSEGATLDEGAVEWDVLSDFFKKATKPEVDKLVKMIEKEDWDGFKKFIKAVLSSKGK
jgi:hypothetical protein